jgi:phosphoserine aminotransferase
MLSQIPDHICKIMNYKEHAAASSLYNTPTCFSIYVLNMVMDWIKEQGGVSAVEEINNKKAALIYNAIDQSGGFYSGHAQKDARSMMNITFRLPDEQLEKAFVEAAAKEGLDSLKGHRNVGGIRASVYNAMPMDGCATLARFMEHFCRQNKG